MYCHFHCILLAKIVTKACLVLRQRDTDPTCHKKSVKKFANAFQKYHILQCGEKKDSSGITGEVE